MPLSELDVWRIKRRLENGEDVRVIAGAYRVHWKAVREIQRQLALEQQKRRSSSG